MHLDPGKHQSAKKRDVSIDISGPIYLSFATTNVHILHSVVGAWAVPSGTLPLGCAPSGSLRSGSPFTSSGGFATVSLYT